MQKLFSHMHSKWHCKQLLALLVGLLGLLSACKRDTQTSLPEIAKSSQSVIATNGKSTALNNFKNLISIPNFAIIKLAETENHSLNYNAEFLTTIESSKQPVVLYCITTWSEAANNYLPKFIDVYKAYGDNCDFYIVNIEACASLAEKYQLKLVPALILINQQSVVWQKTEAWQDLAADLSNELKLLGVNKA